MTTAIQPITLICPNCGGASWTAYANNNAYHEGGLSITCDAIKGQDVCLWSIHLTREQMIAAAFAAQPVDAAKVA